MSDNALAWRPVTRMRMHEQVLAQIEEQIVQGSLKPGDRLPAERELAQALDVSRGAVREAMRILESMGVISASTGSGSGAGSTVVGHGTQAMGTLLRLHLALASFEQDDLVEVRVQLEGWAAGEAAANRTEAGVQKLERLVDEMFQSGLSHTEFNELDTEFHLTIASMSGNSLLELLMYGLRDAVKRRMVMAFDAMPAEKDVIPRLCREHAEILAAIREGQGERAGELVREHITTFYRDVPLPQ